MPTGDAWQAFAGVGGVLIFLGSLVFALQRLGILGRKQASPAPQAEPAPPTADDGISHAEMELHSSMESRLAARIDGLESQIRSLEATMRNEYVSRADWTPSMSRIIGMLEQQSTLLTRLDERARSKR